MAKRAGDSQRFWTTPHALELQAAAALYGIGYFRARDRLSLVGALQEAYARSEVSLVEVVVDPDSARERLSTRSSEVDACLRGLPGTP